MITNISAIIQVTFYRLNYIMSLNTDNADMDYDFMLRNTYL